MSVRHRRDTRNEHVAPCGFSATARVYLVARPRMPSGFVLEVSLVNGSP